MPRGDRTGPAGLGPMTGRAAGYCAGYSVPGFMNPIPGGGYWRGVGRGGIPWGGGRGRIWGGGRGRGYGAYYGYPPYYPPYYPPTYSPYAQPAPADEKEFLKEQTTAMRKEIEEMEKRLAEIEAEEKKKA
ncbi:MAG: DUF5320 domain-containing protein [candidate division WOR-3 bacterium]|nr:DUF5320 domain-containing protein [candidate division WOR-3 bacterium]